MRGRPQSSPRIVVRMRRAIVKTKVISVDVKVQARVELVIKLLCSSYHPGIRLEREGYIMFPS
eukprot:260437-Prorocentrum_minimum.AAC.4